MPYEFTPEDFSKFSEDIIKAGGDQATLTSLLADMQGTYTDAIAKSMADTRTLETTTAENERLKAANYQLFLRVGEKDTEKIPGHQPQHNEEKPLDTSDYMQSYFNKLDGGK